MIIIMGSAIEAGTHAPHLDGALQVGLAQKHPFEFEYLEVWEIALSAWSQTSRPLGVLKTRLYAFAE